MVIDIGVDDIFVDLRVDDIAVGMFVGGDVIVCELTYFVSVLEVIVSVETVTSDVVGSTNNTSTFINN